MKEYLGNETFCLTYGDGVSNVDIKSLLEFHKSHGKIATVSAVRPPSRFGGLDFDDNGLMKNFTEKPTGGESWINGGFFVFEPEVFDYLSIDESCILEQGPLDKLTKDGQLMAFEHKGFWQCMDTLRDVDYVNGLWESGEAPWKVWYD